MADPWDGIPQELRNEIEALEQQWGVDAGWPMAIQPATLAAMARGGVVSYRDFSQYLWNNNLISPDLKERSPWIGFGVSQDQWNTHMSSFRAAYEEMTGVTLSSAVGTDLFHEATMSLLKGEDASQWGARLMQTAEMHKRYGWTKFGLKYAQFQQYKVGQRMAFGHDLSDEEALKAYQYDQAGQGRGFEASMRTQSSSQKQGGAGTDLSVAR